MLYMGVGGSWAPDVPLVDVAISDRLRARGLLGTRDESKCLYGSTILEQSLEYARGGDTAFLKVIEPRPGSVVSWLPGTRDMLLDFAAHLKSMYWNGISSHGGVKFGALLNDTMGELDTIEVYLGMGRLKRQVAAMIDSYLADKTIMEVEVSEGMAVLESLDGHRGEVWVTGPCRVSDYYPSPIHSAALPKLG